MHSYCIILVILHLYHIIVGQSVDRLVGYSQSALGVRSHPLPVCFLFHFLHVCPILPHYLRSTSSFFLFFFSRDGYCVVCFFFFFFGVLWSHWLRQWAMNCNAGSTCNAGLT